MRVWDFPPKYLCDKHLLAQHNEIHAICSINLHGYKGFYNHPEVKRWRGRLNQLAYRHSQTLDEMTDRGKCHNYHMGSIDEVSVSTEPINSRQPIPDQLIILKAKSKYIQGCDCYQRLKDAGY